MTRAAWTGRLRALKREALTVWCIARHPRLPWAVRGLALAVAAYAFSPIDLIPDFIPVVGYLDDLLIVPLGILLAVKLVPSDLMQEFRSAAASADGERMVGRWGAAIIVTLWLAGLTMVAIWLRSLMRA